MSFGDLSTKAGQTELNKHLADKSYIGGWTLTQEDATVFAAFDEEPAAKFGHVARWYKHIASFSAEELAAAPAAAAPAEGSASAAPAGGDDDSDDFDLFGSDDEDEGALVGAFLNIIFGLVGWLVGWVRRTFCVATNSGCCCDFGCPLQATLNHTHTHFFFWADALAEAKAKAAADLKARQDRKIAEGKSSIVFDVKPWDSSIDMQEVARIIKEIEMDGLLWGAHKLEEHVYGIMKLVMMCTVWDVKVSVDLLEETMKGENPDVPNGLSDMVQVRWGCFGFFGFGFGFGFRIWCWFWGWFCPPKSPCNIPALLPDRPTHARSRSTLLPSTRSKRRRA